MKKSEFRKLIREEIRKVIKEAVDPNATYKVDITTSRGDFDPGKVKKVADEPSMVAKAVLKMAQDDMIDAGYDEEEPSEFIMAYKLDNDTYYILTGEEDVTVVGKPSSKKYGQFWSLIDTDPDAAADMFDSMDKDSANLPGMNAQGKMVGGDSEFQVGDIVNPILNKNLRFKIVKLYNSEGEFKQAMMKSPKGKQALAWYKNNKRYWDKGYTQWAELQLVKGDPKKPSFVDFSGDFPKIIPTTELNKK